ncbi:hypothetical protein KEM60_02922 [Austwickia sp. TVS 96-490-7B]|uniref:UTP--glucose-1-phosphate uridylyltransferase n=1 Tax=Austwickia sp. TVS 96-490-7B TaxID=2830843 RepID=UPI001C56F2AC|nr:UTP--glucose-1-phosphate uridylyltransferase [Austwickia sp. TVS 96-490-7B]MBW3086693.1 hypothetical protein [Austwickia sp. TVS 96-490-7B]
MSNISVGSATGADEAVAALRADGSSDAAIKAFVRLYGELAAGATGLVAESDIDPVVDLPYGVDVHADPESRRAALAATAVVRLNGGLGTSMGMERAKSLLAARSSATFLDVIAQQILALRRRWEVPLPLILLDSFATQADSLAALAAYVDLPVEGLPLDVLQSREPKLDARDLRPVVWPRAPHLQWCPPGHGDLYPSLVASGVVDRLRERGMRYVFVANADNLGATPDPHLAAWFAASGAGYAAEVTPRTAMDRKGGHLARRRRDGQLILRDTAQCPAADMGAFTDARRHPFAHCNNVWIDLDVFAEVWDRHEGVLPLPLIRNTKTVDPRDPTSPSVVQIESAVGAAVEVFPDATAIVVPRSRFVPVKSCADLVVLRSDVYVDAEDASLQVSEPLRGLPQVDLDPRYYGRIDWLEARFPAGPPSLRQCDALTVVGDWTFGAGVRCVGRVHLDDPGEARCIPDGTVLTG